MPFARRAAWFLLGAAAGALLTVLARDVAPPLPPLDYFSADEIAAGHRFAQERKGIWVIWTLARIAGLGLLIGLGPRLFGRLDTVRAPWGGALAGGAIGLGSAVLGTAAAAWGLAVAESNGVAVFAWSRVATAASAHLLRDVLAGALIGGSIHLAWRPGARSQTTRLANYLAVLTLVASAAAPLLYGWGSRPAPEAVEAEFRMLARATGAAASPLRVLERPDGEIRVSARVVGLGPTRLTLVDSTLLDAPPEVRRYVLTHEAAHLARGDLELGTVAALLGAVACAGLIGLAARGQRAPRPSTLPRVALLLLLVSVASLPVQNAASRWLERGADTFAARALDLGEFIAAQQWLTRNNRGEVNPPAWRVLTFGTHPPVLERIAIGLASRPAINPAR
jgi:STE24 endopeptidase